MDTKLNKLHAADYNAWLLLACGYKEFYKTETSDGEYQAAWQRVLEDKEIHAFGAWQDGKLIGFTHFLYHSSTWAPMVCYLQDLYVEPIARGRGVATALIEKVAEVAKQKGAIRLYWLTQENNETARALYDRLAKYNGFIRYDYPMI
jgi:GNAT superfamily N-acetyltransferase